VQYDQPKNSTPHKGKGWYVVIESDALASTIAIACGRDHVLALTESGLYGWGCNSNSQITDSVEHDKISTPLKINLNKDENIKIVAISAGRNHSMAIDSDGTVYVGSWDSNLYALGGNSGHVIWKWTSPGNAFILASPAVTNKMVYVPSYDNSIYALDRKHGSVIWSFATESWIMSSPAVGIDGTVYVGSWDTYLYALNGSTGALIWKFKTGSYIASSPAIGSDGSIYFGSGDKKVYALSSNGEELWEYETGNIIMSSPSIGADGTLYIGSYDNNVYAFR